jgi:hypothetical protein
MPEQSKLAHAVETDWVRQYARTYLPSDAAFKFRPALLRREKVTLIDIRNVLRSGTVVFSDKLDDPGALWVVKGSDTDGRQIAVTLHVISETVSVELLDVDVMVMKKGGTNDAA